MKRVLVVSSLVLGALVVAGVVAALWLRGSLDGLVKGAIEARGTAATGTQVTVSSVSISLRSGEGRIRGLRIANPPGFSGRSAVEISEVTLRLDLGSVTKDPVVVSDLVVAGPHVSYEVDAAGKANLDVLRKSVEAYKAGSGGGGTFRRLLVRHAGVTGTKVDVDATALGQPEQAIEPKDVHLTNVGAPSGAPPDEVAKRILLALQREIAREVANEGIQRAIDRELRKQLGGGLGDKLKGLFRKD